MSNLQVAACTGMSFYSKAAINTWGLQEYKHPDAPTLFLGMYFKEDVSRLMGHTGKKFIFWNGSDVTRTIASPEWQEPIRKSGAIHACHNKQLADELKSIGIVAEVSPTLFANKESYPPSYFGSPRPALYMTVHPGREEEYGLSMAVDLFRYLDADLYVYGAAEKGRLGNVHLRGWLPEGVWSRETRAMQGALRLNKHDGTSQIVIKALLRGHYAIVTPRPWDAYKGVRDLASEPQANVETIPNLNGWIDRVREEALWIS